MAVDEPGIEGLNVPMWRGAPSPANCIKRQTPAGKPAPCRSRRTRAGAPAPHSRQKEKANLISQTGLYLCRQRPEFILSLPKDSHTLGACSTIGLT